MWSLIGEMKEVRIWELGLRFGENLGEECAYMREIYSRGPELARFVDKKKGNRELDFFYFL